MNLLLCRAIDDRKLVRFAYRGGNRIVEPYCHGVTKGGHELLRGYQTTGYSSRGRPEGWRLFRLDEMADLTVTEKSFRVRWFGYDPDDAAMDRIFCRVERLKRRA